MAPESESKKDKGVILMRKGRISGEHKMTNIQQKTPTLSSYTLVESWKFKEAFNLFDRKGSGNIAASSLGNLLRSIGQNPTQSEIQELVAQADPSSTGVVSFDAFSKIAMRADGFKPAGTTDQLIEGFKVFDPLNNGTIPATELRH
ncbi:hypothetical protein BGZ97_005942, partial [Linnemannia gamsii]